MVVIASVGWRITRVRVRARARNKICVGIAHVAEKSYICIVKAEPKPACKSRVERLIEKIKHSGKASKIDLYHFS